MPPTNELATEMTVIADSVPVRHTKQGTPIRFSICIPNYNYGRYLKQTIESVLAQTYPHFEVIVADNASTDDSVAVVQSFSDSRIRLIRNQYNIGFAPNLDRAADPARLEFMILLSSDDLMLPTALEAYAQALEALGSEADAAVVTSALNNIDSDGNLIGASYRKPGSFFYTRIAPEQIDQIDWSELPVENHAGHEALAATLRAKNSPAAFLATCYSRSLFDRVQGYHSTYRVFPDGHFLNKLLAENPRLVYVPQRLFAYREHASNQLSQEASSGAIKYPIDAFMLTLETPQKVLDAIGVRRQELIDVFVRKAVMERGLLGLVSGSVSRGFKCLCFGFATYPAASLKEPRTYLLAVLVCLGPVGALLARLLYRNIRPRCRARR